MRTKKRSASSAPGSSPFGTQSRLVVCPICSRSVHRLLATSHVESHFTESGLPEEPEDGAPATVSEGAVGAEAGAFENADPQVEPPGTGELPRCAGDSEHDELDEGGDDGVPFGAAVGEPVADSTPGCERLWRAFKLQVMSGDSDSCGLCYERFELGTRDRFCLWPCQHTRQCGPCALRLWQTPKAKRRCPWCAVKLDTRPRAFRPFM